jgi:hypothetical protein
VISLAKHFFFRNRCCKILLSKHNNLCTQYSYSSKSTRFLLSSYLVIDFYSLNVIVTADNAAKNTSLKYAHFLNLFTLYYHYYHSQYFILYLPYFVCKYCITIVVLIYFLCKGFMLSWKMYKNVV